MLSAVRSFVGQDGIATPSMACVGSNKVLAPALFCFEDLAGAPTRCASAFLPTELNKAAQACPQHFKPPILHSRRSELRESDACDFCRLLPARESESYKGHQ